MLLYIITQKEEGIIYMKDFMYRIRKRIAVVLVFILVAGLMPLSGIVPMETRAYEDIQSVSGNDLGSVSDNDLGSDSGNDLGGGSCNTLPFKFFNGDTELVIASSQYANTYDTTVSHEVTSLIIKLGPFPQNAVTYIIKANYMCAQGNPISDELLVLTEKPVAQYPSSGYNFNLSDQGYGYTVFSISFLDANGNYISGGSVHIYHYNFANDSSCTAIGNIEYKIDNVKQTVEHYTHWGPDYVGGPDKIYITLPSNTVPPESFELFMKPNNSKASVTPISKKLSFVNGIAEKAIFTITSEDNVNTKTYEVIVKISTKDNANIGKTEAFIQDGDSHNIIIGSGGPWWPRYRELSVIIYCDTVKPDAIFKGIVHAEDAEGYVNGNKGYHIFDVELKNGWASKNITIKSSNGEESLDYTIFFIINKALVREKPTINSLVVLGNDGFPIDLVWNEDEWAGWYSATVPNHITTITDISFEILDGVVYEIGKHVHVPENIETPWVWQELSTPFSLDVGSNSFVISQRIPGHPEAHNVNSVLITREADGNGGGDQGGHSGDANCTAINFKYKVDGGIEQDYGQVSWWEDNTGRRVVKKVLPSSFVVNQSFELFATTNDPLASVSPTSQMITFTNNKGTAEFAVVSADKSETIIYDVTVEISSKSNVNIDRLFVESDGKHVSGACWGGDFEIIRFGLKEDIAHDAKVDVTISTEDEEAFVKCIDGNESKGSHTFKVQLENGMAKSKFTIISADRSVSKEYDVYLIVGGLADSQKEATLDSVVAKGNGGVEINFELKTKHLWGGGHYHANVPNHITTITEIDLILSDGVIYKIGEFVDIPGTNFREWEELSLPLSLNFEWNRFLVRVKNPWKSFEENWYTVTIDRDPNFDLSGGSPNVAPEDIFDIGIDDVENKIEDAISGAILKGEDSVEITIGIDVSKSDDGTAISGDSLREILSIINNAVNEVGDEIDMSVEIEVKVRDDLTVRIDLNSITDPEKVMDVDLNFGIIPVTKGTQFRNDDSNTKVTVPANSIVIAPPTHGQYGFEVSFIISEAELLKMGLNGNNIKLYYLDEFGIPRPLGNDSKLKRNADGSVTITISGASIYILMNEDDDFIIEPINPPSDKKKHNQTNQTNQTSKTGQSSPPAPTPNFGSSSEAEKNWGNVGSALKTNISSGTAFNHVVRTGMDIIVPAQIFNTLKGTNGTVMLNTGAGVTFSISGGNIPAGFNPGKFDLSLNKAGLKAPANKVTAIKAGSITSIDIPMVSRENFGMPVGMHYNVGAANAGKFANLFRFNESSGEFEYLGSFLINDKGQAMFGISGGADYVLTVTATKPNLPIVSALDSNTYTVRPGDTLGRIASRHGMRLQQLLTLNPQISNPNRIRVGQIIRLQ